MVLDLRPRMMPPPPVRLEAIGDVRLVSISGLERSLDNLYLDILRFDRDGDATPITYRAENWRIIFDDFERPPQRDDYRLLGIVVPFLSEIRRRLIEAEIDHEFQPGLLAGQESLILADPCGNLLQLTESKMIA